MSRTRYLHMNDHHNFHAQLEAFRTDAELAAQFLYCQMAVQHAAWQSKKLLHRLNMTPLFWNTHLAATQAAAYMALGRVFDTSSDYNVKALLNTFERQLDLFSREALESRKLGNRDERPEWLDSYLDSAYYPTIADVARLRRVVERHREFYARAIKPVRHKVLAHRERLGHEEVQSLYRQGKIRELWRTSTFLLSLHRALWEQLENGRKPVIKPVRHSVRAMLARDQQRSGVHEMIVRDTAKLMQLIAAK
jgi:hypothetical protein